MKAQPIHVEHRIELWPGAPGVQGKLPPAALSFTMGGDDISSQLVRTWVADGESWYSDWPGKCGPEGCCTHLCSLGDPSAGAHEIWGERMQLDQSDQLLCRMGGDGQWVVPPDGSLDGEMARAMVVAMRELLLTERPPVLGDGEVVTLPGPPAPEGISRDVGQRSWHVRAGDRVLRALERPPLRDFETGRLRARYLSLATRSRSAFQAPGQILWTDQEVRIFAADDFPGLDESRPASHFGPTVELLANVLRHTPWTRDVDLE